MRLGRGIFGKSTEGMRSTVFKLQSRPPPTQTTIEHEKGLYSDYSALFKFLVGLGSVGARLGIRVEGLWWASDVG